MNGWQYNSTKCQFEYWYDGRITAICTTEAWDYYWNREGWGRYNAQRRRFQNRTESNA